MIGETKSIFLYPASGERPALFCFHHAGGNSRAYSPWRNSRLVDVVPVELPGRGIRISEEPAKDIDPVSRDIADRIATVAKRLGSEFEFSLFGHSLGAILAFCVAATLTEQYHLSPCCLQVSGRHAPQDQDPSPYRTSMGIAALEAEIRELGHTPQELLENDEFRDFFMSVIFNDYVMGESYRYDQKRLDLPIYAYSGSQDRDAGEHVMERWQDVTTRGFQLRSFDGDHFFLFEKKHDLLEYLVQDLLECSSGHLRRPNEGQDIPTYERGVL